MHIFTGRACLRNPQQTHDFRRLMRDDVSVLRAALFRKKKKENYKQIEILISDCIAIKLLKLMHRFFQYIIIIKKMFYIYCLASS